MVGRRFTPARFIVILGTALAVALAAGCGSQGTTSTATSAATQAATRAAASPATPTAVPPTAGGTVTLLAHDSFVVTDSLIADFEKKTGLTLKVVTAGDAGAMVAGAILAAGQPSADVLFGVDNTLVSRALAANVFAPYTSPAATSLEPALKGDTSGGMVTPIDYGDVCVNIDDRYFAKAGVAPPATLADLTRPEYKDLLVVEDPGTSSPGLAFLLATIARYPDTWKDYWAQLQANGVKVAGSWTDAYEGDFSGGGKGDRPLVVSYATSPPAEIVYASDPKPTKPSTSVLTDGCYRQVEYAGVLAGAANPAAGQQVVDWLLSEPVQADVPLSMFVFPARAGVALPDVFTKFAAKVADPLQLPPQTVADNLPTWLADWGTVMGR